MPNRKDAAPQPPPALPGPSDTHQHFANAIAVWLTGRVKSIGVEWERQTSVLASGTHIVEYEAVVGEARIRVGDSSFRSGQGGYENHSYWIDILDAAETSVASAVTDYGTGPAADLWTAIDGVVTSRTQQARGTFLDGLRELDEA